MFKNKKLRFVFILGAAKCGTTSLYYYLNQHHNIHMSDPKEPLFFEKEYNRGIEYYIKTYYPGWDGDAFLGEARHRNLYLPYMASRIAKLCPDAKLIVIIRNPIERAFSHYMHRVIRGFEDLSFEDSLDADMLRIEEDRNRSDEEIENNYLKYLRSDGINTYYRTYIDSGYYAEQIERYLRYFDKDQLLIIFMDDLKRDPQKIFWAILKFLDKNLPLIEIDFSIQNERSSRIYEKIHTYFSRNIVMKMVMNNLIPSKLKLGIRNITKLADNKFSNIQYEMSKQTRYMLSSHFKEHNKRLEILTNRDLSCWDQ